MKKGSGQDEHIRSPFERPDLDHVVRMVPHLCLAETGDTKIALPVDVFHFTGKKSRRLRVDRLVDPFAVRQPFLEMDKRSIRIKALEQGYGCDLP